MTIARKLLIAGALLVGMQPITQAYDVVGLKEEVKMISYFIERNNVDIEHEGRHINLGTWLQYKINCTYRTSNYDIIEIAKENYQKSHSRKLDLEVFRIYVEQNNSKTTKEYAAYFGTGMTTS